jgi:hypothetical protein
MAKYSELARRYHVLHRVMCGLAVMCLIITIVGCTIYNSSDWERQWAECLPSVSNIVRYPVCYHMSVVTWITVWSLCVVTGVMAIEYCMLKVWAAWEEVHHGVVGKRKH